MPDLFGEGHWQCEWVFLGLRCTYYHFEDTLSSLVMVGPPGRRARCHVKKHLWEAQGVFEVTLGLAGARIKNLAELRLEGPTDSSVEVVAGDPTTSPSGSFNEALSSYQFCPL